MAPGEGLTTRGLENPKRQHFYHAHALVYEEQKNRAGLTNSDFKQFGGPCRDRTDDLLHAMEALSQLS